MLDLRNCLTYLHLHKDVARKLGDSTMPRPRTLGEPDQSTPISPSAYDNVRITDKVILCLYHEIPFSVDKMYRKLHRVIVPIALIGSNGIDRA
jgi:hypothetical protein